MDRGAAVSIASGKKRCAVCIQRAGKQAGRKHADKASTFKLRNADGSSHISFVIQQGNRKDLRIRHALRFGKSFRAASLPMDYALILRTDPQVALSSRQLGNVQGGQGRMKRPQLLSVINQY